MSGGTGLLPWPSWLSLTLLSGCESTARGITSAILESRSEEADDRLCSAVGTPFPGIEPYLQHQDQLDPLDPDNPDPERPQVKILYVHGNGTHTPSHGTDLVTNLARSLDLSVRSPRVKRIVLESPTTPA